MVGSAVSKAMKASRDYPHKLILTYLVCVYDLVICGCWEVISKTFHCQLIVILCLKRETLYWIKLYRRGQIFPCGQYKATMWYNLSKHLPGGSGSSFVKPLYRWNVLYITHVSCINHKYPSSCAHTKGLCMSIQ